MSQKIQRKREGFEGQRLIVLPKKITSDFLTRDMVTKQVYITDIGYYPKARFHYIHRSAGIGQHIIIYCEEGSGWVEINKQRVEISPAQFIAIPAGTPHAYGSNEQDPWTIYWIHFKGEMAAFIVDLILQRSKGQKPHLSYNENRQKLFGEIYANLEKGYSMDNLRYVNMIFYHFLSSLLYEDKFNSVENKKERNVIDDTIQMMQKNLQTVVPLNEFAESAGLSVSHFSAVFREKTGYAPIEYFNQLKIQKACQYLLFSPMTIKEIGWQLGIEDQYYFSRMFSRLMGLSPTEYRKKNRSEK
jgi:AraC family transcriptional regulator, arabinose operon regulatory protein